VSEIFTKSCYPVNFAYNLQVHMNNKKSKVIYTIGLSSSALALVFMILPNNNNAMAQQSSSTMSQNRPQPSLGMSSGLQNQNQNWTGSKSLFSPILDAFKSKIHTSLNDATTSALNAVGGIGSNASVFILIQLSYSHSHCSCSGS
jgi:predicted PurR-regulated permease PerM